MSGPTLTLWMLQSSILQFSCNVYKSLFPLPGRAVNTQAWLSVGCVIAVSVDSSNHVLWAPRLYGMVSESAPRGGWQLMELLVSCLVLAAGRHSFLLA